MMFKYNICNAWYLDIRISTCLLSWSIFVGPDRPVTYFVCPNWFHSVFHFVAEYYSKTKGTGLGHIKFHHIKKCLLLKEPVYGFRMCRTKALGYARDKPPNVIIMT